MPGPDVEYRPRAIYRDRAPGLAARVAETLLGPDSFTGWGIRTVASGEARFNPISYHNGSIWPHDNAMIALGFARYGLASHAAQVFSAMFEAAAYQELRRLPEVFFCGFIRKRHRGPTAYPVACAPQAWASAAPFAFLEACLGMELRHEANAVSFRDPVMPAFLDHVTLTQLSLGNSRVDLKLRLQSRSTHIIAHTECDRPSEGRAEISDGWRGVRVSICY